MEERSLLELANKLREERGLVAYVDLEDKTVKILNAGSTEEFTVIKSEEEVSDDSLFSTGRKGAELLDPSILNFCSETFSVRDQELSEIAMLMFCDDISKDCLIGGIFVKDDIFNIFNKTAQTKSEIQIIISQTLDEEKKKIEASKRDLTMLRLANDLRKDYGMIAYSMDSSKNPCVVVKLVDRKVDLEIITARPKEKDLPRYLLKQKGSVSAADHMDVYTGFFDSCFPDGVVNEGNLLLFCDMISNYLQIGEVYLDNKVIYVLGKPFSNRGNLISELPILMKETTVREQRSALEELAKLAYNHDYIQNGKAVLLDGVAYVADSSMTFLSKTGHYYIEGYLVNGKVVWSKVDKSRFKSMKVETDHKDHKGQVREIFILETLYFSDLHTVYRSVVKGEEHVVKSPYPVALLEDGEYAYYFETKTDLNQPNTKIEGWKFPWKGKLD